MDRLEDPPGVARDHLGRKGFPGKINTNEIALKNMRPF